MKNIIIAILTIIVIASCKKTKLENPPSKDNYIKMFGSYYNDYVLSSEKTSDNGLIITGFSENDNNENWAYIAKSDNSGMVIWETSYTNIPGSKCIDGIELSLKNTYACIISNDLHRDTAYLNIDILNSSGTTTKSHSIVFNASDILGSQVFEGKENNLLVFSQISVTNYDSEKQVHYFYIHNIDNQGNISLLHHQKMNFYFKNSFSGIKHNSGRYIVTATTTSNNEITNDNSLVWVFSLKDNIVDWERIIGTGNELFTSEGICYNGDTISVTGNYKNTDSSKKTIHITSIDITGKVLETSILNINNNKNISCSSMDINKKSNFILSGNIETGTNSNDILFIECDINGRIINESYYGSSGLANDANNGNEIHYSSINDNYFIVGEIETLNNYNICILKIDNTGKWIK